MKKVKDWTIIIRHNLVICRFCFSINLFNFLILYLFFLAYIRIKTNTTGAEFLYLPLEVEVTSQPGIYSPQEIIDFGLVPSKSDTKTVKLLVYNSGSKAIQVQNVIATPVTEAISVHFKPLKVQPETLRAKAIAEVTFNRKYYLYNCVLI